MFSVYTLSDPRTGHVRYVGFTRVQLALRLRYHISEKRRNARKREWIASVRRDGRRPTIELLESFSVRRAALDAEAEWISMLRSIGCDLVNITPGGFAPEVGPETRAKMSAAHKGKVKTVEHLRSISEALKGHEVTDEMRSKMSAAKLGTKWSEARRRAHKITPESTAKRSEATRLVWARRKAAE